MTDLGDKLKSLRQKAIDDGMLPGEMPMTNERLLVLARFIRNQVALADRPPPGCIQLNNDEASLCAEALERSVVAPTCDHAAPSPNARWCSKCGALYDGTEWLFPSNAPRTE